MNKIFYWLPVCLLWMTSSVFAQGPAIEYDLQYGKLVFQADGVANIVFKDGSHWSNANVPAFELTTKAGDRAVVKSCAKVGKQLQVTFSDGAKAVFDVQVGNRYAYFKLADFSGTGEYESFRCMQIGIPGESNIATLVNKAEKDGRTVTVMTASPNVRPLTANIRGGRSDKRGSSHSFVRVPDGKVGKFCGKFTATCGSEGGGWSVSSRIFDKAIDISNYKSYRVWVHGDGNGQSLKIQIHDDKGGVRDDYIPITFKGWKQIELNKPALNKVDLSRIRTLMIYYNGLPKDKTVECLIDQIEAVVMENGKEKTVVVEDFESLACPFWDGGDRPMFVESYARHGLLPFAFGVLCCDESEWTRVVPTFQRAAGLPSPRLGGQWNKTSGWIKESYFFLTRFKESQYEDALAIAKRGHFKMILLLDTWRQSAGHYEVNTRDYPDGLESLKRVIGKFNSEGIKVGLHFLAASIDRNDPYIRPVPDKRLVKGAHVTLAGDIDAKAKFIETVEPPQGFPTGEKDAYRESGRTLWIDDELIYYDTVSMEKPYGFKGCARGYNQSVAAAHTKGTTIDHLVRAYGYYMFDLDSTLGDEVARNFAKTANQLNIEMVYFDGSERLQRPEDGSDHWYYNAKLHKNYFDHVHNKNILYQGSSTSPYSWHQIARQASADGHDDLKAYLEERSGGWQTYFKWNHFPLDVGWYYAYDKKATLDMYEYVLCATIAYDSSMSLQVSVDAAKEHPFTGEILDLIRKYDDLRTSGRVSQKLRTYMQMNPILAGTKTEEERNALLDYRRDFRYVNEKGREGFQRVVYSLWNVVDPADSKTFEWDVVVKNGKAKIGFQVQVLADPKAKPEQKLVNPKVEINGKVLTLPMTLVAGQYGTYWPNEPISQYGKPLEQGKYFDQKGEVFELPDGKYRVKFLCDGACPLPTRVRVTQTPEEFHFLDEK